MFMCKQTDGKLGLLWRIAELIHYSGSRMCVAMGLPPLPQRRAWALQRLPLRRRSLAPHAVASLELNLDIRAINSLQHVMRGRTL